MQTAQAFHAAGCRRIAATIQCHGVHWLSVERAHVLAMAAEFGIDIMQALRVDLCEYDPQIPLRGEAVRVDVIIPFCESDSQYLAACMQSIADQRHSIPTIHVIADGCDFPELPQLRPAITVHRYHTPGDWGPYRITNAVVAGGHCQTQYLAIQDADDTSRPDRLWRQVQTLKHFGADMISSASQNFLQDGVTDKTLIGRLQWEPIIKPGRVYDTVPLGRLVNSTRTLTLDLFHQLNGFGDLRCTGDFQFDNRARFLGVSIIDDQTVLADRRLHTGSMTGGRFVPGTAVRDRDVAKTIYARDEMQRSPTLETARQLGCLDQTRPLYPIR